MIPRMNSVARFYHSFTANELKSITANAEACTVPDSVENGVLDPSTGEVQSTLTIKLTCGENEESWSTCTNGQWNPQLACPVPGESHYHIYRAAYRNLALVGQRCVL